MLTIMHGKATDLRLFGPVQWYRKYFTVQISKKEIVRLTLVNKDFVKCVILADSYVFLVLNLNMTSICPNGFIFCNGHTQFLKRIHKLFKMPVSVALSKQFISISNLFVIWIYQKGKQSCWLQDWKAGISSKKVLKYVITIRGSMNFNICSPCKMT
jgi:hypothetical protein